MSKVSRREVFPVNPGRGRGFEDSVVHAMRLMVFGATSAVAKAVCRQFASDRASLYLVARDGPALADVAADLRARGATVVETAVCDALDWDRHPALVSQAAEAFGGLDAVLVAHGTLPDQAACEASFDVARTALDVNLTSVVSLLTATANLLERQGHGVVAVLSSVAGDRGRKSNYIYGAAKGAINVVLQGLRNRLHGSGVRVVTIKLGRVDTPMTASFEKGASWARPDDVAPAICRAIARGTGVVYVPGYWRLIMLVLRSIPEAVFKRLSL